MIRIDRISFEFTASGEDFAHSLYADWDGFCRECVERVLDECLSAYDRDRMLHVVERLDLDLGSIPEEDFRREFPKRLKEELLKKLPAWGMPAEQDLPTEENTSHSRLDNLLHYLEHGHPLTEWADADFSVDDELTWLESQTAEQPEAAISRLSELCLKYGHVLRRLLWQTENKKLLQKVFTAALTRTDAGQMEKRRFLAVVLEERPEIPLRFIHASQEDDGLRAMAELLDNLSVWQLMRTETEEHAEVDAAPYWHGLYEWLVRYYPFNGIAIFGGKADFIRHLHFRLLRFIHKRGRSPFLSKMELTASFLLEVFGEAYYVEVLNRIYRFQPLNPDGSPVSDSLFDRDFYRILRSLSLLPAQNPPQGESENSSQKMEDSRAKDISSTVRMLFEGRWNTVEGFMEWINDTSLPDSPKRELLQTSVSGHTQKWMTLLQKLPKEETTLIRITGHLPMQTVLQGIHQVNFYQASVLSETIGRITQNADTYPFLFRGGMDLQATLSQAMLLYMMDADTLNRTLTEQEIVEKFLACLRFVYTGKADEVNSNGEWQTLANAVNYDIVVDNNRSGVEISVKRLSDERLTDNERKSLLHDLIRLQPKELLKHIRRSVKQNTISIETWGTWLEIEDWQRLAASLSLPVTELLRQVMEILRLDERVICTAWAAYIIRNAEEIWRYNSPIEHVRQFVETVSSIQRKSEAETEENLQQVSKGLHGVEKEDTPADSKAIPEVMWAGNAGLCLLAPWFVRLFTMLGYLDEERKKFRSTASKIRAVFLLQYLAYGEEKTWREMELGFNRLLTALPGHVPLPAHLPLTVEEKETADSMIKGVKANWPQMNGTSVGGFRGSFLVREGRLEQEEERWLLTVKEMTYDILLESIPWGFRQIRLPWLKKYVQVIWHEKIDF
ncbi:contractile injection system tape measure protein [Bacteroides fluxus]|uniref:contractile injection system tape measure protein n=1 Tax=Bacteroides fluxus TaxID=626930 RepID=UPI002A828BB4|nr:contractile injection system tape measure protein [Bacteroides fluxus]MDY3788334.1 contractile injection system tape measure protein [Bacteroides fluxus]